MTATTHTTPHWTSALVRLGACPEAVAWCRTQPDQQTAWDACQRGNWMLWILGRLAGPVGSDSRRMLVGAAAECARLALPVFERGRPGDTRVRECLDLLDRYAAGDGTVDIAAVRAAADATATTAAAIYATTAAYAAAATANAANAAYATNTANAAADATHNAAYAYAATSYAAHVADIAYISAAASAAHTAMLTATADAIRGRYPTAPVLP